MAIIGGFLAIGRLLLFISVALFFFCLLLIISVFYKSKEKKFKINKLVSDEKKNSLGEIVEKNEEDLKEEASEYKIYFLDKDEAK